MKERQIDVLEIVCDKCGRRGRYRLSGLIERHGGDMGLPRLATHLKADCPNRSEQTYGRWQVHFPTPTDGI